MSIEEKFEKLETLVFNLLDVISDSFLESDNWTEVEKEIQKLKDEYDK